MALTPMWPPSDGTRNTISFNGRTYSSTPGVAVNVESFDVPVLQANGWTIYSTAAGQAYVPMKLPATSKRGPLTINGRTYDPQPGATINVPTFDAPILEANGWGLVQLAAAGGSVPANTVLPAISGTAQIGTTLTASPGTWTNGPVSYAYQWTRGGTINQHISISTFS